MVLSMAMAVVVVAMVGHDCDSGGCHGWSWLW